MQAWRLKQLGWKQRDIAVVFDVTEGAVSQWMATARSEGPAALLARPSPGHPPKLGLDQLRLVPDFLSHGAEAYGFRGEVWTCAASPRSSKRSSAFPTIRATSPGS